MEPRKMKSNVVISIMSGTKACDFLKVYTITSVIFLNFAPYAHML
jgi:hypothetical protein